MNVLEQWECEEVRGGGLYSGIDNAEHDAKELIDRLSEML